MANIETWDIDGTVHQVGIRNVYINSKGNLVIESSTELGNTSNGNINIESMKNVQIKPGGKGDIRFYVDHLNDMEQMTIHAYDGTKTVTNAADDIPVRLKLHCSELEVNNKDSVDRTTGLSIASDGLDIKIKKGSAYVKCKIKASALDLRTYATGAGTGGGIAVQIASCDSNYKENKFKIETDRIVDVAAANATSSTYSAVYCGEGGKGIEIVTINSQFFSAYVKEYRFKSDAPIYAVTRGALTTDATTGKVDYPTQSDDSKDIKNDASPITWADVIKAVKYLKSNGSIS